MSRPIHAFCAALAALALAAAPALAQPKPTPEAQAYHMPAQQAADEKVVQAVLLGGGFRAIGAGQAELKAVLDRAPARFPRVEERPGLILVRDEEGDTSQTLTLLLKAAGANRSATLLQEFNTYGLAALLLASYANETKQPAEAVAYADRGLALQPDNAALTTEKALALEALRRPADALTTLDAWLKAAPLAAAKARARVLRARGYALVELGRLDEGEAAYRQSLELEPGHRGAENELAYIAGARKGQPPSSPPVVTTYGKAKDGTYQDAPKR